MDQPTYHVLPYTTWANGGRTDCCGAYVTDLPKTDECGPDQQGREQRLRRCTPAVGHDCDPIECGHPEHGPMYPPGHPAMRADTALYDLAMGPADEVQVAVVADELQRLRAAAARVRRLCESRTGLISAHVVFVTDVLRALDGET